MHMINYACEICKSSSWKQFPENQTNQITEVRIYQSALWSVDEVNRAWPQRVAQHQRDELFENAAA